MTWRAADLAAESMRNLGRSHAVVAALFTVILVALGLLTGGAAHTIVGQEVDRRAEGSLVWIVAAATSADAPQAELSAATCHNLERLAGVEASGGVLATEKREVSAFLGGPPLPLLSVTPGGLSVFDPSFDGLDSATMGDGVSHAELAAVGSYLSDASGIPVLRVTAVLDENVPYSRLASTVQVPVPPVGLVSECWVRMAPAARDKGYDLLTGNFDTTNASVAPFVPDTAGLLEPSEQWRALTAMRPWLAGAILLAAVVAMFLAARRSELAIYRTFGTTPATLMLMLLGELGVVLAAATACAALTTTAALLASAPASPSIISAALLAILGASALGFGIAAGPIALAVRPRITDALKDRA